MRRHIRVRLDSRDGLALRPSSPNFYNFLNFTHNSNTSSPNQINMADQNGSADLKENVSAVTTAIEGKGKGKAVAEPQASATHNEGMDVDDSSSEEEVDEVSNNV